jgi:DNA-directed RNA polymerase subunit RPC12/RpoP
MLGFCLKCGKEITAKIRSEYTTLLCKNCGMQIIYLDAGVKTITKQEYELNKKKEI